MSVDYEKLEAELDAEIAALNAVKEQDDQPPADEVDSGENDTVTKEETSSEGNEPQQTSDEDDRLEKAEKRIRDAQAKMTQATQEAANLRRQLEAQSAEIAQLRAEISQKQPHEASRDDEMDSLLADEYVGPLAKRNQALEREISALKQQLQQTVQFVQSREQAQQALTHEQAILKAHPDAFELANTEDFQSWGSAQPPAIRQIIQNGSAEDVIYVLNQYKTAKQPPATHAKPDNSSRVQAAKAAATPSVSKSVAPKVTGNKKFTLDQIKRMSPAEYDKYEAEIDEALSRGDFY